MTRILEIAALAAQVWDKDEQTSADLLFLEEISIADRWCSKELSRSNWMNGPKSNQHQAIKLAVSATREQRYVEAFNRYQDGDGGTILQLAAE